MDRSVIHIDSRERNLSVNKKCNPFSVDMTDDTTCLVSVRDMILSNVYNDPYLLIQISEYKRSLYENQVNREIHYKMVRTNKDQYCSYYINTDPETMIRLRDINKITFNVIRPNGRMLYSHTNDVCDVTLVSAEERKSYLETTGVISNPEDDNVELLEVQFDTLKDGDTLTLFDTEIEQGDEVRIVYIDKKGKKVLVEYVESKTLPTYTKALINKYQISISLEII